MKLKTVRIVEPLQNRHDVWITKLPLLNLRASPSVNQWHGTVIHAKCQLRRCILPPLRANNRGNPLFFNQIFKLGAAVLTPFKIPAKFGL